MEYELRYRKVTCCSTHPLFAQPIAHMGRNRDAVLECLNEALVDPKNMNGEFVVTMFDENNHPHEVPIAWQEMADSPGTEKDLVLAT
jgi:hypothetical protein